MKIDDCESLKKWLVQVLTPMFDGDPEKLALYIVALAKKVDNDLSSRQRCIEDLEVFLEAQTNAFVNQLFDALVNKTYTTTTTTTAASTPVVTAPAATVAPVEQQPRVQQTTPTSRSNQRPSRTDHYHSHDSKSSSGYYNRRSDGRGRSRSNERRRGGGGGRNRSRGGRNRGGSSSSSSSSPSPVRRRSRSRSGASRSKSRSRSPFYRSDKSRNSDSYASKDTRTVVPSSNNGNEASTGASGGKRQRCRDYDEKGFCTAGEFCPYEHSNAVVAPIPGSSSTTLPQSQYQNRPYQKRSKSSYQPKYRNNQPQQQQPTSSDMFNQPPPQQQRPIIGMNPLMGNRPRNLVELTAASSQAFDDPSTRNAPVKRSYTAEFNLQIAPPGYNNNTALLPTPPPTNLIQPPANIIPNQPPPSSFIPPPKNLNYTPSFPTTNAPLPSGDQFNSSLVVRRIPVEMNRVENLSQHFAQFGPIVDIQCAFESNSDAALVVFGNNQAAQAAFKCPQPVFNNRFIRLYWLPHHLKMTRPQQQQQSRQQHPNQQQHQQQHSAQFTSNLNQSSTTDQEMTQRPGEDQPPQMGTKRPARDRLSYGNKPYEMTVTKPNEFPNKENQQQQKFPPEEITKTIYNPNATKTVDNQPSESSMDLTTETQPQQQQQQIDFSQLSLKTAALEANKPQPKSSIAMARQIESENQKKVLMLKLEVQRKARELMEKQIKDQKVLLEKFEKAKTPEEKSQIYALIKKISEAIEKEKEILNESPSGGGKAKVDSTHSRVVPAAPHLLKLNNKRLNTTSFLKGISGGALSPKTVAAAAQQPASPSASSAAVSAFFNYSKVSVDNRPKKILFSGINTQNEKTNIVNFISTLGVKIDSVDQIAGSSDSASTDASTDQTTVVPFSIVLTFATRKDAEFALTKCSASLTSKRIKIAWYRPEQEQQQPSQNQQQQQQQEPEKQSNPDTADIEAEMKPNGSFDNVANNSLESSINKPSGEEVSNEQQPQQGDHQIEMVLVNNNDENNDVFEDLFTN